MRGMLPITNVALALLVAASSACGHTDRAATPDRYHYADVSHALHDLRKRFEAAELLEVEDDEGRFTVDKYNVEADGLRFVDRKQRRFLFIPWERWAIVEIHRFQRDYFVHFEDEDIELRYTSRIDRPGKGAYDGQRFFAAIRYLAREHLQVEASLRSQPVDLDILERALAQKDCTRTESVDRKLDELRDPAKQADWSELQLEPRPDLRTAADAYATWLVVAHEYLQVCEHPRGLPAEVLEQAGSVGEPVATRAIESRDCIALRAIETMDLWPYDDRFVEDVRRRDFAAAERTRREWLETLKEARVRCVEALGATRLDARIDALNGIVGLEDDSLVQLRAKLLDALVAGDAHALVASARAVAEREKIVDPEGEAAHTARQSAIESMAEEQIRGRPRPDPETLEARKRAHLQVLTLFGLADAQPTRRTLEP